jgi:hypothetical protein
MFGCTPIGPRVEKMGIEYVAAPVGETENDPGVLPAAAYSTGATATPSTRRPIEIRLIKGLWAIHSMIDLRANI